MTYYIANIHLFNVKPYKVTHQFDGGKTWRSIDRPELRLKLFVRGVARRVDVGSACVDICQSH